MKLSIFFAKRYLFSKKSVNAINIISSISMVGVMVSSAALIILLSFFNGLQDLILSMYSKFTPEIRIEPSKGKLFSLDKPLFADLAQDSSILAYTPVLQEKILLEYGNRQYIGEIKGIDPSSIQHNLVDSMLYTGTFDVQIDAVDFAVIGAHVQSNLGVSLRNILNKIQVFSPKKGVTNSINPADDYNIRTIHPSGVLRYQSGSDNLMITSLSFAQEALGEFDRVSAIEFYLKDPSKLDQYARTLQKKLGADYQVKTREQQNPTLYKTVKSEKWVVYFILTIIGIIAIFNVIGSLTMLVIDKKKDMDILGSLGADASLIKNIFFYEGMMISLLGCVVGLGLGYLFCIAQQLFKFIRPERGMSTIVDAYPVSIRLSDFLLVACTILVVSTLISYLAARLSVKELEKSKGQN